MKSSKVIYKKVEIENFSSTGGNVTRRDISCLVDGVIDGKMVKDYETSNFTHSLSTAKIVIDALLACGTQVSNGRLVMTIDQLLSLTPVCMYTSANGWWTITDVNKEVAKIMEAK